MIMKNLLFLLSALLLGNSIYAQAIDSLPPVQISIASYAEETNQYSNDKIATSTSEMIFNKQKKAIKGNEKVQDDVLIVLKNDGSIVSYNANTWEEAWSFQFSDDAISKMRNKFRVENAILYATSSQRQLVALNVNNGSLYWQTDIGNRNSITRSYQITGQYLPIKDNLIYLASCNQQLYALDKYTGAHVWNYKLDFEYNLYSPAIYNNHLVIPNAPWIYYFDAVTGEPIWQRGFGNEPMYVQPQIDNRRAYISGERGIIYALNIKNNADIDWQYKLEGWQSIISDSPILQDDVYYFATVGYGEQKTSVYALNAENGQLKWETSLENKNKIRALSLISDCIIGFFEAETDAFFVLDAKTGNKYPIEQPKEPIISNIIHVNEETVAFLTKHYYVEYHIKENRYKYQELNLNDTSVSKYNVHISLVKRSN